MVTGFSVVVKLGILLFTTRRNLLLPNETAWTSLSRGSRGRSSPPKMYACSPTTETICEERRRISPSRSLWHLATMFAIEKISAQISVVGVSNRNHRRWQGRHLYKTRCIGPTRIDNGNVVIIQVIIRRYRRFRSGYNNCSLRNPRNLRNLRNIPPDPLRTPPKPKLLLITLRGHASKKSVCSKKSVRYLL
jgi:hypothetical protein